jgi:hypothetical protein
MVNSKKLASQIHEDGIPSQNSLTTKRPSVVPPLERPSLFPPALEDSLANPNFRPLATPLSPCLSSFALIAEVSQALRLSKTIHEDISTERYECYEEPLQDISAHLLENKSKYPGSKRTFEKMDKCITHDDDTGKSHISTRHEPC